MITIYKYPLQTTFCQNISIHEDFTVLHVGVQNNTPCIWALVNTSKCQINPKVYMFGTGHNCSETVDEDLLHIGTVQLSQGGESPEFVGHIFI